MKIFYHYGKENLLLILYKLNIYKHLDEYLLSLLTLENMSPIMLSFILDQFDWCIFATEEEDISFIAFQILPRGVFFNTRTVMLPILFLNITYGTLSNYIVFNLLWIVIFEPFFLFSNYFGSFIIPQRFAAFVASGLDFGILLFSNQ